MYKIKAKEIINQWKHTYSMKIDKHRKLTQIHRRRQQEIISWRNTKYKKNDEMMMQKEERTTGTKKY